MNECNLSGEKVKLLGLWREVAKKYTGENKLHFNFEGFEGKIKRMNSYFKKLQYTGDSEEIRKIIGKIVEEIYARGKTETTLLLDKYNSSEIKSLFLDIYESNKFDESWIGKFTLKGKKGRRRCLKSYFGELYGTTHIDKHPIRNNASITGLEFFGFKLKGDYQEFEINFDEFKEKCYKKNCWPCNKRYCS